MYNTNTATALLLHYFGHTERQVVALVMMRNDGVCHQNRTGYQYGYKRYMFA